MILETTAKGMDLKDDLKKGLEKKTFLRNNDSNKNIKEFFKTLLFLYNLKRYLKIFLENKPQSKYKFLNNKEFKNLLSLLRKNLLRIKLCFARRRLKILLNPNKIFVNL